MSGKGIVACWMDSLNHFSPNGIGKIVKGVMNKGRKHWASTLHHFVLLSLVSAPIFYALHVSGILPFGSLCGTMYEKVPGCALFLAAGLMAMTGCATACASYCSVNVLCAVALTTAVSVCWHTMCQPALMTLTSGVFSVNALGMFLGCSLLVTPPLVFAAIYCLKGMNPVASVMKGVTKNLFHFPLTTVLLTVLMTVLMLPLRLFGMFGSNNIIRYCNKVSKVCCRKLPPMFCPGLVLKFALCFMIAVCIVGLYVEVAERAER